MLIFYSFSTDFSLLSDINLLAFIGMARDKFDMLSLKNDIIIQKKSLPGYRTGMVRSDFTAA